MKNRIFLVLFSIAAAAAAACTGFERQSSLTAPTAAGNGALMGNWASASSLIPSPGTCTNFVWNVTEQTATSAKGSFSATCPGDLHFTGTAQGGFTSTSVIAWSTDGNATGPGLTSCAIRLTGTATLGTDAITIPYDGETCLGHVNGIETMKRH